MKTTHMMAGIAAALSLFAASQAMAGPAVDTLSTCLVSKTSQADRLVLIRWIYAVMGHHPGVADMTSLSPEKYEAVTKQGGEMFNRLLTVDCASETRAAIKAEGMDAMSGAFEKLGQVAMGGLMSDPAVEASLSDMVKYVDQEAVIRMMVGG